MERLDAKLAKLHPEYSRNVWQKLIREGAVRVDGKRIAKASLKISLTAKVEVDNGKLAELNRPIAGRPDEHRDALPVIFSSKSFFVFDKPPGIRTEEALGNLFSVHRLDKGTSGILVAAKTLPTQGNLQKQWAARKVKKTYTALVRGKLEPKLGAIDAGIKRHHANRKKMTVSKSASSRPAVTEYKVLKYLKDPQNKDPFTLLLCHPLTGRTHQIRVHLASIGFSIFGDELYGKKDSRLGRQFLHASQLSFVNPDTKKKIIIRSKLPVDLEKVMREFS